MQKWLAVYDIPDDRRRQRVARILDGYGKRVQYSAFEVVTRGDHFQRMVRRLQTALDEKQDNLRLYPACENCARKVITLAGEKREAWRQRDVYIV